MDTSDFYMGLAPLASFAAITDPGSFAPLPADWQLVITDVRGSTRAIAEGRYKEVNMVGAASIVALLNAAGPVDIPFVFGGDGATLAIPPGLVERARRTLAALGALARQAFGLDLRCAVVPVAALAAAGQSVGLARLAVAEHYNQAAFSGGLAYAEALIKDPIDGEVFLVGPDEAPDAADLSGLECRWQDIRSRHGETVSLLITPAPALPAAARPALLRDVIARLEAAYGSERDYHPLAVGQLRATIDPRALLVETRARTAPALWPRLRYLAQIWGLNLGVRLYRHYEAIRGRGPWWDQYRDLVVRTADYRKYDDTLRMIIAGTPAQRQALEGHLEARFRRGELAYGIHVADRALMTCLVFERMGRQVHFVDGADGGYALAARALKGRLAALRAPVV
ncbi:MAG TPA: DUF3095 domain-containing protein [Chloroflexaceae bacterium]|nr:DUF3095 domain-containing protein [Chloroflexaceae bacterium]